ncbi:MAG: response regulator [Planctomycetes bacterium]|nr:response regulator [Planctomycetota bacterium]
MATEVAFVLSAVVSVGLGLGTAAWHCRRSERDRAARSMNERLERVTENVPGGVFIFEERTDGTGQFIFASGGLREVCAPCKVTGKLPQTILGMLYPGDRVIAGGAIYRHRAEASSWRGEYRSIDGARWLEIRARPEPLPDGSCHWHGFVADVTDRKHAEVTLREAKARAERASRIKGEFVANTSHELRTPLAAIAGYAELLLEEGNLPAGCAEAREAVDAIARNAEHMLGVIGDIVDGEQVAAGRLQVQRVSMDAAAVASDVTRLLAVRAQRKGLELRFEGCGASEASVSADPLRVRQILLNLAGNALKFTEHGSVTIAIEPGDRSVVIAVRDTGPGMDAEQVSRLFERFSQTSKEHASLGSGLGLAISRQLARLIGGNITVTSAPGSGTTFRLHLPRTGAPGTPEATPALSVGLTGNSQRPLDGLRVLLAEDGTDNVRVIRHHLVRAGASVTVVGDGRHAAATVRAAHMGVLERPFDLVLMDVDLPGMDGLSATRDLRASGIDLPIVALTAHAAADDRVRALDAGCDDFASKPLSRTDLLMLALRWGAAARGQQSAAREPVPAAAENA